jgi:hypothetical protein
MVNNHLRLLSDYVRYYHEDRTHLGLGKGTPNRRVRSVASGRILSHERLGGLHHSLRSGRLILTYTWPKQCRRADCILNIYKYISRKSQTRLRLLSESFVTHPKVLAQLSV